MTQPKRYLGLENRDAIYCMSYIRRLLVENRVPLKESRLTLQEKIKAIDDYYEELFKEYESTGVYEPDKEYIDAIYDFVKEQFDNNVFTRMQAAMRQNRRRKVERGVTVTLTAKAHRMLSSLATESNETLSDYLEGALRRRYKQYLDRYLETQVNLHVEKDC